LGPAPPKQIAELFLGRGNVDRKALDEFVPVLYDELRRVARYHLRQQRGNHTLQTTALVHEVYLRLAHEKSIAIQSRAHFLGIAAQLMRWILVDYERKRRTTKRGAGATLLTLDSSVGLKTSAGPQLDLLLLDEALDKLSKLDSQQSQIVELRYFGGLSIEDTAESLGISPATTKRSWASARVWLLREMNREGACA